MSAVGGEGPAGGTSLGVKIPIGASSWAPSGALRHKFDCMRFRRPLRERQKRVSFKAPPTVPLDSVGATSVAILLKQLLQRATARVAN